MDGVWFTSSLRTFTYVEVWNDPDGRPFAASDALAFRFHDLKGRREARES
jgi:hypothetical protein